MLDYWRYDFLRYSFCEKVLFIIVFYFFDYEILVNKIRIKNL